MPRQFSVGVAPTVPVFISPLVALPQECVAKSAGFFYVETVEIEARQGKFDEGSARREPRALPSHFRGAIPFLQVHRSSGLSLELPGHIGPDAIGRDAGCPSDLESLKFAGVD